MLSTLRESLHSPEAPWQSRSLYLHNYPLLARFRCWNYSRAGTPEATSRCSCVVPSAVRLCRICSPKQLHSLSFNHPIVTILPTPSWYAPLPAITQALQHPTDTCGRARPLLSLIVLRVMLCRASTIILHCLSCLLYKNPGTPSLSMGISHRMNRSFKP